jgi:hypothetical protein
MTEKDYINATVLGKITAAIAVLRELCKENLTHVITDEEWSKVTPTLCEWQERLFALVKSEDVKDMFIEMTNDAMKSPSEQFDGFEIKKVDKRFAKYITGYFELVDPKLITKIQDQRVFVVDDVISSGSTFSEMMKLIASSNPKSVSGFTIFKT